MPDIVTRRPRRGRAYASSPTVSSAVWNKIEEPGGRKLWIKLVLVFTFVVSLGICLIALGAAMFTRAYDFHKDDNTALPMGLCIVSIVSGTLLFFGGIILGKMVISSKWRKNQQPNYNRRNRPVRHRVSSSETGSNGSGEIDLPPPPYDLRESGQPSIYFLSGNMRLTTELPPPPDLRLEPPEYTEESVKPPSYSLVNPLDMIHNGNSSAEKTNTIAPKQTPEEVTVPEGETAAGVSTVERDITQKEE